MAKTKRVIYRQMLYDRYNYKMDEYLDSVYSNELETKLKADLAFQAANDTRWSPEEQSNYMTNVIVGKAPSTFVFADVESCRDIAEEDGRVSDYEYYDDWFTEGTEFLNIDSNNRNICIYEFLNGRVTLNHGTYQMESGNYTIDENNDTIDTLPKRLKEDFFKSSVLVTAYTDATREELSEIFVAVNDGQPLNNPEKRNASTSKTASYIRDMAKEHKDFFTIDTKWFTNMNVTRRLIDDFLADFFFFYYWGWTKGSNKERLASMYQVDSVEEKQLGQFKKTLNGFMKWIPKDAKAISNRNSIFDLFFVYKELVIDGNYKITDTKGFIKEYITIVSDLLTSDHMYKDSSWKVHKPFSTMIGGRQVTNNKIRNEEIMKRFRKVIDKYGHKLDSKRTLGKREKMISAANQGFKTPENKTINLSKLQTKEYHNGHGKSWISGGKTTLDNNYVQEAKDNLKLSKKDLELSE